jgi:hypothetical protein
MKKTLIILALFFGITSIASANTQGYAWSESVGWFDFSNVVITDTEVLGYAYNDNTGWLNFTNGTVSTTWSPATPRRSGSVSGSRPATPVTTPTTPPPTTQPQTNISTLIDSLVSQGIITTEQATLIKALLNNNNNNPYTRDLTLNTEGDDVKQLQQFLISKGYTIPAGPTGFFGAQTEQALIKFQQDNNITPAIGYFGPITRNFINNNQ